MLEADSDLYNTGIVDVSYRYPKMFVIRPQFFIPIISLLRNAAKDTVAYRRKVKEMNEREIDVTNFENKLMDFKNKFSLDFKYANDRFDDAIKEIEKTISHLKKVKENLELSKKHLSDANGKSGALTIKSLTDNNPTMKKMFAELQQETLPDGGDNT